MSKLADPNAIIESVPSPFPPGGVETFGLPAKRFGIALRIKGLIQRGVEDAGGPVSDGDGGTTDGLAMETQGFVKQTPNLSEQLADESRANEFTYKAGQDALWNHDPGRGDRQKLTEHQGLTGLTGFLDRFSDEVASSADAEDQSLRGMASSIRENLTFIGQKEYDEAAKGVADYWKHYLLQDPKRMLAVIPRSQREGRGRKSDSYFLETVLDNFNEQERKQFAGRIVNDIRKLNSEPGDTKVILPDDWSISGEQMNARIIELSLQAPEAYEKYKDSMEANLIVADKHKLDEGIQYYEQSTDSDLKPARYLPTKAYFQAHQPKEAIAPFHITGVNSSVDYLFEEQIGTMVRRLNKIHKDRGEPADTEMPPLTNIIRAYRQRKPKNAIDDSGRVVNKFGGRAWRGRQG
jgi:hypothetical protein